MSSTFRSSRTLRVALALGACATFSGCLFDTPYWAQTFATTTTSIPIQTWVTDKTVAVKIECSKAYHGGLYPFGGPEVWTFVTNITPSGNASYDPANGVIYSAGKMQVLPSACWHADGAYSPPLYMTALRATQGSSSTFFVFDAAGLACLGQKIGQGRSWFTWSGCELKYSGSSTAIPYVRVIAGAPGAMATGSMSSAAPAVESAKTVSAEVLKSRREAQPDAALLGQRLGTESVDASWASPMEASLRAAFDTASPEGSQLLETSCRSTMCRVDVMHADAAAQMRFAAALAPQGLFTNDGQRGFMQQTQDASGSLRSTYFIAREGHHLADARAR